LVGIKISEVKTMSRIRWIGVSACTAFALACGSDPKPPPAAPPPAQAAPPPAAPAAQNPKPQDDGSSGQINISDEILKACGIQQNKAMFGFDSAQIQAGDQPVLNKLAECFISGPLKGRSMRLIGHADPRGEPEYNMVLGGRRADNVKSYLVRKGLPDAKAETTSRGEMDAVGTDEGTWASDRRVDITLVSS
jgi:peptidoglycan-associated lipoprotein